jgi:hypothetical protein
MSTVHCVDCRHAICLTDAYERHLRSTHETFFCPRGHQLHFPGKSAQELEIDSLTAKVRLLESRVRRLEMELPGHGICPVCLESHFSGQRGVRVHISKTHEGAA